MDVLLAVGAVYVIYRVIKNKRILKPGIEQIYDDTHQRRGKAQLSINKENLMPYLRPTYDPTKFNTSKLMKQRTEARIGALRGDSNSSWWNEQLKWYNLRGEVGGNTGIAGPLYYRWG
jgi:hypothetical protein